MSPGTTTRRPRTTPRVQPVRWDLLPRVSSASARLQRLVAAHLGRLPAPSWAAAPAALVVAFGGTAPRVTVGVPYAFEREELEARFLATPWVAVRVERPDRRGFVFVVDAAFAAGLTARLVGAPAELPAPRAATAAERGVLAGLVALALDAAAAPGLIVAGVTAELPALAPHLADPWVIGFDLRLEAAGLAGVVRVLAPESLLSAAPPGEAALAPPALARLAQLPGHAEVVLALAALAPAELAGLARGDVLVLPAGTTRGRAWLRAGHGAFELDCDDTRMTVSAAWRQGVPMPDPDDALVRDLTVPISCRLARLELSLRELVELGPGAVIGLGQPLGAPVDLVAGERVVARGELVDIDGELGVRVSEIVR